MYARMALFMTMLNGEKKVLKKYKNDGPYKDVICTNEHCITHRETYLPKRFKEYGDMLVCEYCENSTHK